MSPAISVERTHYALSQSLPHPCYPRHALSSALSDKRTQSCPIACTYVCRKTVEPTLIYALTIAQVWGTVLGQPRYVLDSGRGREGRFRPAWFRVEIVWGVGPV